VATHGAMIVKVELTLLNIVCRKSNSDNFAKIVNHDPNSLNFATKVTINDFAK